MTKSCSCPGEAGNAVCDLSANVVNTCPECGKTGKHVQGQTIKSFLTVSPRQVQDVQHLFCRTPICTIVYFSADGEQTFTVDQVRERVYQKELDADDVLVCYCFHHTAGELRAASRDEQAAIVADIDTGIHAGQCACDLRNPQGSCCLGNIRGMIKQLEKPILETR